MSAESNDKDFQKSIEELEAELQATRQQLSSQHQQIAQKFGSEFLAVLDGNQEARVVVTPVVEKLVFQNAPRLYHFQNRWRDYRTDCLYRMAR